MFKFLRSIVELVFIIIFPFVVLIRTAVYLHIEEKLIPWACIGGGVLFTSILIFLYLTIFYGNYRKKNGLNFKTKLLIAFGVVCIYSAHGLFYISGENFKSNDLRKEIRKVQPEDYAKMGLPSKSHSLHYKQSNGYAHAIDLRTNGRNEIRNFLVQSYFKLMGFQTLRHIGTGDHLHISLKSHDRPYSK